MNIFARSIVALAADGLFFAGYLAAATPAATANCLDRIALHLAQMAER